MNRGPVLRVARPTDRLETIVAQYRDGLGFEVLGSFEDHEGFDGVLLGNAHAPYHLEFTRERGVRAEGAPSAEHLLVFYEPDEARWNEACVRMEGAGFEVVSAHNPYWDRSGRTFLDADGYRVVLANRTSPV